MSKKRKELDFQDERYLLLELEREARLAQRSELALESLHFLAMAGLCGLTAAMTFGDVPELAVSIGFGVGVLSLAGFLLVRAIRLPMGDLYRQFGPRENFLLLIVHGVAAIVPLFLLQTSNFRISVMILTVMLAFQSLDRLWCGRLLALQAVGLFIAAVESPYPAPGWAALWFVLFLSAARFSYLRFRLDEHTHGGAFPVLDALQRSLLPVLTPAAIGFAGALALADSLSPMAFSDYVRSMAPEPGTVNRRNQPLDFTGVEIVGYAALIVMGVIGLLLFFQYLERKLRRRKKAPATAAGAIGSSVSEFEYTAGRDESLREAEESGARERILRKFSATAQQLGTLGKDRRDHETPEEYARRLLTEFPEVEIFNAACYARPEPSEQQAVQFEAAMERVKEDVMVKAQLEESE